jgi:hypothetical protein
MTVWRVVHRRRLAGCRLLGKILEMRTIATAQIMRRPQVPSNTRDRELKVFHAA